MKTAGSLILLSLSCLLACSSESHPVVWTMKTDGRILSHPVTDAGVVFFGNSSGSFYAVGAQDGRERWSYRAAHSVRGAALVAGASVFVVSGNDVHALDAHTGAERWTYRSPELRGAEQIDPWDYHAGFLVINDTTLYAGLGSGYVLGFDTQSGTITTRIATVDTTPVRSGLLISDGVLYFGDWDGRVYAHDLRTGAMKWTTRTFDERPYESFGGLTAGFTVDGDLLYFGARNTELRALDKHTGAVRWRYVEETGGWISGDPVVESGILYIGGSDNHALFAFDARTGDTLWTFSFAFNNFSRPLIHGDVLFLTTGDAYSSYGDGIGRGFLYALDRNDGSLEHVQIIRGNAFTTPAMSGGLLFVGSEDSTLYAFDAARLTQDSFDPAAIGYDAIRTAAIEPQSFDTATSITYSVAFPAPVYVRITTLADSTVRTLVSGEATAGDHSAVWDGRDDGGDPVDDGVYFVKVGSQDYYQTTFIQKKSSN
jgi:outer membrane protein assembly factor BamB